MIKINYSEKRVYALRAGQVIVADNRTRIIERVLTTDPGMGVVHRVDAGYTEAVEFAEKNDVKVPMMNNRK